MGDKFQKYYIDWWNIRKSTIYLIVAAIVLPLAAGGIVWYAMRHNWFNAAVDNQAPANAARIISFEGDVRVTRAATRETIVVTKPSFVAAGDTIQTQADGRAVLQMVDGSIYTVRPNSTIVVRDNSSLFGGTNVRVALDDGGLNVRTDQQAGKTENIVEMAESENKLLPQTDATFNADAQTNGGEIRISRGGVETSVDGQTTTLNANEYAAINAGKLTARERLQAPPQQSAPANYAQIVDTTGAGANVNLSWQDIGGEAAGFYLQVSRSPYFASDSILVDRAELSAREFRVGGLSPGTYYWRLRSTARSGQKTDWSEPWKFTILRSEGGRSIDVTEWRVENVGGSVYLVTGRTQPGLAVRSQGREVFAASDGSFRLQISSTSAVAPIELGDDRGNRAGFILSLRTGSVTRRF
ncbi:MAG: hypothetical protein ACK4S4_13235 [Pyrinomonadaceae bacterium]